MRTKQISLSSTMLLMFYKRWLEGDTSLNRTEHGLCLCINHFVRSHYAEDVPSPRWYDDMVNSLLYEMRKQFEEAGLSAINPFNKAYADYFFEVENKMCHLNPLRIQWVKDRIEDANNACIE